RIAASAQLALIVPIGCNDSPRRSCQRDPSAFRQISTVSGSARAAKKTSPRSFRSLASCRSYVPSLSTPLYYQGLRCAARKYWFSTKKFISPFLDALGGPYFFSFRRGQKLPTKALSLTIRPHRLDLSLAHYFAPLAQEL